MKRILWLASWYPNRLEPLSGDFIERHARAASLMNDISVIHVIKDYLNKTASGKTVDTVQHHPHLRETTGYYKSSSPVFSLVKNFLLQKKLIDQHIREHGKPDMVNVHISYKAGLGALYCKWRHKLKFIVSEQWTIFCPEAVPGYNDQPFFARWLMKTIYKNASACSTVSNYLAASLVKKFDIKMPLRIPNVVDGNLFYPDRKNAVFTFIHISVLNYQKSPEDIIDAVELLRKKTTLPFRFIVYGPNVEAVTQRIDKNNLRDVIDYRSEINQVMLAAEARKCQSLILYSKFETFGCVVIEAMAAGLPVIVSDIPVMRELIEENITGTFVALNNPEALAERMLWMMQNYHLFDAESISMHAQKYSFEKVGKLFDDLYAATSTVST